MDETKTTDLIDSLRCYARQCRANCKPAAADLIDLAADRLEELEKLFDEYFLHC